MKKILLVSQSGGLGLGAERVAIQTGNFLIDSGFSVVSLVFEEVPKKYSFQGKQISNKSIFHFGWGWKKLYDAFIFAKKIAHTAEEEQSDIVVAHAEFSWIALVISKLFFRLKVVSIGVVHASLLPWPWAIRKMLITILKQLDKIVVVSSQEYANLQQIFKRASKKIFYIPNMISLSEIASKSQLSLGNLSPYFSEKKYTFVTIGRLSWQKNQRDLLFSFDRFWQEHKNTQLLIIGEGDLKSELLSQKSSLSASAAIHFLGVLENPYPVLKNADCFVLSSRFEGLPTVLLEAMALQIPIISSNCPTGPGELLSNQRGLLVDVGPDFVKTLSLAMNQIYTDTPLRKKILSNSIKYISQFDAPKIMHQRKDFISSLEK